MAHAIVSTEKTGDAVVKASAARLHGVVLNGDGTNGGSVVLYDHASAASGAKLLTVTLPLATHKCFAVLFPVPIAASNGLFADLTGTNATCNVFYE